MHKGRQQRSAARTIVYLVTFAVLMVLFVHGFSYYLTPYAERARQLAYRQLRPAGEMGLIYGIMGASMMVIMLTYSLRKRMKSLARYGALSGWLHFHIYLGIVGPLFIILHTSFKVQGLVAVSFWSMVVVAASGYFGRYLYLQIPRNIQGNVLSLQELEESNRVLNATLVEEYQLSPELITKLDSLADVQIPQTAGLWHALGLTLASDVRWWFTKRRFRKEYAQSLALPRSKQRQLMRVTSERTQLRRRIALLSRIQQLFHYWYVLHKPFAIIMYIVMSIHITVAVWTGYAWVF